MVRRFYPGSKLPKTLRTRLEPPRKPSPVMLARDFPELDVYGSKRIGVCRRCHLLMNDCEPGSGDGEFWHLASPHQTRALRCRNDRKRFGTSDAELVPFMPKSRRRALKRMGIRA